MSHLVLGTLGSDQYAFQFSCIPRCTVLARKLGQCRTQRVSVLSRRNGLQAAAGKQLPEPIPHRMAAPNTARMPPLQGRCVEGQQHPGLLRKTVEHLGKRPRFDVIAAQALLRHALLCGQGLGMALGFRQEGGHDAQQRGVEAEISPSAGKLLASERRRGTGLNCSRHCGSRKK
ncbi:hypothetical protein C666_12095 [Thauera linaloolentis 47Lol = DSM 12138]|uniref:Uncharacterized protein n=1 Tax=Thauera linaloolentis (strain DSM 12138 / JCM 21573 / CCUG 41526 / CIP 105981 / IAM 15112 / NBRC 102519 / 47Lol) TaxID=1123367 RepID=N6YXR2_THAL4|nr:hypothetical protein C666_12095 [Thauera linaloolentis 47Lol = DSM 12138]